MYSYLGEIIMLFNQNTYILCVEMTNSVKRKCRTSTSKFWLIGWNMWQFRRIFSCVSSNLVMQLSDVVFKILVPDVVSFAFLQAFPYGISTQRSVFSTRKCIWQIVDSKSWHSFGVESSGFQNLGECGVVLQTWPDHAAIFDQYTVFIRRSGSFQNLDVVTYVTLWRSFRNLGVVSLEIFRHCMTALQRQRFVFRLEYLTNKPDLCA